jgi:small subunit ribosomal protein S6
LLFLRGRAKSRKEDTLREYELMYILDPTLDEDGTKALIGQVEDFMAKQGIKVEKTDPWGKRRLAYNIGKHWEGYYVLNLLQAPSDSLTELERRLRVTDGVLRFITVRIDEEQAKLERSRAKKAAHEAAKQEKRGVTAPELPPSEPIEAEEASSKTDAAAEAAAPPETAPVEDSPETENKKEAAGPVEETN